MGSWSENSIPYNFVVLEVTAIKIYNISDRHDEKFKKLDAKNSKLF